MNPRHSQNVVALQLRLDAESWPGDHRAPTWVQAAELIERSFGPDDVAAMLRGFEKGNRSDK